MHRRSLVRHLASAATVTALVTTGLITATAPAHAAGDINLCVSVGRTAGFTGERLVTAVAVAMAESRCDPLARNSSGNTPPSTDRGLWQINDYWHPDVPDSCAYNAQCNANAAYRISRSGSDWTPWTTYDNGSYRQFLDDARAAIGTPAPNLAAKSVNGDRYDDVIGIDASGVAWLYPGKQGGGLGTKSRIGSGWTPYEKVAIGDSNGDGWADLFAQDGSVMYYWHNRGNGTFNERARVGGGWDDIDHFSITDVNGDNKADILARDNNNLNLYIGLGRGAFTEPDTVGPGWSGFPRHSGTDADGDGDGDIWATNGNGDLYFWKRNGGSYSSAVDVGGGWNNYRLMTTMDINGDSRGDIVAVHTRDHTLHQWLGRGDGRFNPATQIGHGWETFRIAVF